MNAIYLVRINEQGQVAEHWDVADTIGIMGQPGLLPAPDQAPPNGADRCVLTPGTHADLDRNDRELIVLRQAKGSCRFAVAAISHGTAHPWAHLTSAKVSRCLHRTVRHARQPLEHVHGRSISGSRIRPGLQAAGWPCCASTAKIAWRYSTGLAPSSKAMDTCPPEPGTTS